MEKSRASKQLEQLLNLYIEQQNSSPLLNMSEKSLISKMQDENAARIIISYTNKLLTVQINRSKGLGLLDKLILHCPVLFLTDNAITWTNICVNYSSKDPINMLRFTVLVKIMQTCSGTPDYNKSVMQLLPKIIDMCLSVNPGQFLNEGSLECLKICLQKYPSTCGPFKNKIETYLIKYVACVLPVKIIKKSGSAFHYLQQVGGSGPEGITHKNNWSNQLTKLCSTMHKLYDQFFARVTEFEYNDMDVVPFEFSHLNTDERNNSVPYVTANALKNVVTFTNCMLIEHFPVEKSISIVYVLDVIKRGLQVDTYSDHDKSIEDAQFAALLYSHQIDLLYLLRSLIACFKQNVIPFSFTITKLLTDCLQRTQKNYFKSSSEYQKAVYKVLNYWITIAESKLNNTTHNKLVTLIISEITPAKTDVMLCLNENLTKNKGKGKKKTVQEPVKVDENIINETQSLLEIKEKICIEALKTGKSLLQHVMLQLDQETFKILFQTIIQHILNIQGGKIIHPYSNPKCQAYLYEMLTCILLQPTFCMSPLLQITINIFVRGQSRTINSNNDQIVLACTKGLDIAEKLCQPMCPTLHINNFIKDDEMKNRKRVFEYEADDEIEVNGFGTVNIVNENQNIPEINEIAQIFSQPNYSNPPKKINIIHQQVIREAICSSTPTFDKNIVDDVPKEKATLDISGTIVTEVIINKNDSFLNNTADEQSIMLENDECKSEITCAVSSLDNSLEILDNSINCDNSMDIDESDMLNSFQDVLSQ